MAGDDNDGRSRPLTYCLIPRSLAPVLNSLLCRHFRDDPAVAVLVDARARERRRYDRRSRDLERTPVVVVNRRRVRNASGRRVADRRAEVVVIPPPPLPRGARVAGGDLVFLRRLERSALAGEDIDTARLVVRFQAGEIDTFAIVYTRYFERVYTYARMLLRRDEEAEDATQQVFLKTFEALPSYELRSVPFRSWLFTIARHEALDRLDVSARVEPTNSLDLERQLEAVTPATDLPMLEWISDHELLLFIERLPLAQRQVLLLRYMHDLPYSEIATILKRSSDDVRKLQQRAIALLRSRLVAIGREPRVQGRTPWRRRPTYLRVIRSRRYVLQ
jgi:RNA polymerase sigma-70 factor (ECF subfamily)